MFRRATFGVLVFALFVFAACEIGSSDTQEGERAADIAVEDFEFVEESNGMRVFRGKLHNKGDERIGGAQVKVSLVDEHNRQSGTAYIEVTDIEAGEQKNFRQVLDSDEEYRGARVQSVLIL